ncbi:MAG: hypothetical protein ABEJ03_05210 [Candidatus Nanohaloarchaea archaeon]
MREYKGFDDRGTVDLGSDEYEVESEKVGSLESDIVRKKIEGDLYGVIFQEDFDGLDEDDEYRKEKDYGISEYLSLDQDTFPRNWSNNGPEVAEWLAKGSLIGLGVAYLTEEPAAIGFLGALAADYQEALKDQDRELRTAIENSRDRLQDYLN